ncbi:hypothetical protein DRN62_02740 [Nanoarchaeota archaeon]|nr:nucleotidyltransferase domain-containing protein [Nanoarchaeota archaeon]RLG16876.1 MAG: hypothetical protein DRN62_02740 [Nanoarchaeota archaeon]
MFKELNTLRIFFEEPTREFNVREVARILRISPATASKQLKVFAKEGILKERKERTLKLFRANLESEFYRDLKLFYNLRKVKSSGLLPALNKFYLKPTVVLFGSAAHGLDTEDSDFDLLVISEKRETFPELSKFEKRLNRKLQLFVVRNVKDLRNEYLMNSVLNGIVLQGEVKWI